MLSLSTLGVQEESDPAASESMVSFLPAWSHPMSQLDSQHRRAARNLHVHLHPAAMCGSSTCGRSHVQHLSLIYVMHVCVCVCNA